MSSTKIYDQENEQLLSKMKSKEPLSKEEKL